LFIYSGVATESDFRDTSIKKRSIKEFRNKIIDMSKDLRNIYENRGLRKII
jgi:hypothetical protein